MPIRKRTVDTLLCEQCGTAFPYKASGRSVNRFCGWDCLTASRTPEGRFWARVDKHGPIPEHLPDLGCCWCWLGSRFTNGYGQFWLGATNRRAHTVAFEWEIGPIPDGLIVCHRCDNPICVRPSHLFADTAKGNAEDRDSKGRGASGDRHWTRVRPERVKGLPGASNGMAKLTEADVIEIRRRSAEGVRHTVLAKEFNVSTALISMIVRRKIWQHVP